MPENFPSSSEKFSSPEQPNKLERIYERNSGNKDSVERAERVATFKENLLQKISLHNDDFSDAIQKFLPENFSHIQGKIDSSGNSLHSLESAEDRDEEKERRVSTMRKFNAHRIVDAFFGNSLESSEEKILETLESLVNNEVPLSSIEKNLQEYLVRKNFSNKTKEEKLSLFVEHLGTLSLEDRKSLYSEIKGANVFSKTEEEISALSQSADADLIKINTAILESKLSEVTLSDEDFQEIFEKITLAQQEKKEKFYTTESEEGGSAELTEAEVNILIQEYIYEKFLSKEEKILVTSSEYEAEAKSYEADVSSIVGSGSSISSNAAPDTDDENETTKVKEEVSREEEELKVAPVLEEVIAAENGEIPVFKISNDGEGSLCALNPKLGMEDENQVRFYIGNDGAKSLQMPSGERVELSGEITSETIKRANDGLVARSVISSLGLKKFFDTGDENLSLRFVAMCMKGQESSLHKGKLPSYSPGSRVLSSGDTETQVRNLLRIVVGLPYPESQKGESSFRVSKGAIENKLAKFGLISGGKIDEYGDGMLLFRHLKNFAWDVEERKRDVFIANIKNDKKQMISSSGMITPPQAGSDQYSISSTRDASISQSFRINANDEIEWVKKEESEMV